MAAKIISIVNQKGGVGKTTTAINVSSGFAIINKKVLVIDLDPQGNTTSGLTKEKINSDIYRVLIGKADVKKSIYSCNVPNLFLLPSNIDLVGAEIELLDFKNREHILKNILSSVVEEYDLIFIDCPPSLNILTINALCCSDSVIIPLQAEYFALEGLAKLVNTLSLINRNLNPKLVIEGILLTMLDRRNNLCRLIEEDVREKFGDLVFKSTIPRNIKLSEAPSHAIPALLYDTKCIGSVAYMLLVKEIIERDKNE